MNVDPLSVPVQVLPHGKGLDLPAYTTEGAVGMDLRAAVTEPVVVLPRQRALIPTGIRIAVPSGYEAQIRPRSGLALRHGLTLPNTPGTIDADYRGEVKVIVANLGEEAVEIERGARIAQLVFAPVVRARWQVVEGDLDTTGRGEGGFGHTGRA